MYTGSGVVIMEEGSGEFKQENMIKEQERIVKELSTARQIQSSVLPHIFPPFPERREIDLFASMDPARDVGGDFYDFFFVDEDHLCLVIADVSGKGIPAALFMMFAKRNWSRGCLKNPSDMHGISEFCCWNCVLSVKEMRTTRVLI